MNQSRPRVAIRADASVAIGLGHLKRCLSLAQALRAVGAEVRFVVARTDVAQSEIVQSAGFQSWSISSPLFDCSLRVDSERVLDERSFAADAQATCTSLREWAPQWVVVDHYAIDARWHQQVRFELNCQLAAIDDLADRELAVELLIDQNLHDDHRSKYLGRHATSARLQAGPRYALLGPSYAQARRYEFREKVESIGIFMGGTDPQGFGLTAIRVCREGADFQGKIEVVATQTSPHLERLIEVCRWDSKLKLSLNLPDLSTFFASHDIQIGAGGGANWERCCVGAPTLLVAYAENQKIVVNEMVKMGAAVAPSSLEVSAIGDALSNLISSVELRRSLIRRCSQLVDGLGAHRVALSMLASGLTVRRADAGDSELMYRWRNAHEVRAVSRNGERIGWADHSDWLDRSLSNPQRLLLVGEIGSHAIGVVRFDRNADQAEVSLYLDPSLIGTGIGHRLLASGERYAARNWTCVTAFLAETLEDNASSQRLFEKAGYSGSWRQYRKQLICDGVVPAGTPV